MFLQNNTENKDLYELKKIFLNSNIENDISTFSEITKKLYDLEEFKTINKKLLDFFNCKNSIAKNESELLKAFLFSNLKLEKHDINIELWNRTKNKINVTFDCKGFIYNCFAFSFVEKGIYEEAKKIFCETKHMKDEYLENYIDCLINLNQFELALKELSRYSPKSDRGRVFKSINIACVHNKTKDFSKLKKSYSSAKKIYQKYRISEEITIHSLHLFTLAEFEISLNLIPNAILNLKHAIDVCNDSLIDTIYKNKSIEKLKELGVEI